LTLKAENGDRVETQLIGDYNFENLAAALCIGKYFEVDAKLANEAVREYKPGNMRSQWIAKGSNTIILDAYNANPTSMKAAIQNLAGMQAKSKVAIVGDMYELEAESEQEHSHVGELLLGSRIDKIFLCGPMMKAALKDDPRFHYFETKSSLMEYLLNNKLDSALILVKASRGMALETILDFI
jgi:UDP-N-acetylmuramoyl-tripeptide--D-alanyl-D-alanine ligase